MNRPPSIALLLTLFACCAATAEESKGVFVQKLTADSPEATAGLRAADVILRCDDQPITSPHQLRGILRNTFAKSSIRLKLQRGATIELKVPYFNFASKTRPIMSESIRQAFDAARKLEKSNKAAQAIAAYAAAAQQAATAKADLIVTAWLYQQAGFLASRQRQHEASYKWQEKSWEYAKTGKDGALKASVLSALGNELREMQRFPDAQKWYQLAVAEYQALGHDWSAAIDLNNTARVVGMGGDPVSAEKYLLRAVAIYRRLRPDTMEEANTVNNLGIVSSMTGRLKQAGLHYQDAVRIYEKLGPRSINVSRAYNNMGALASARGELAIAYEHLLKSLEIKEELAPDSVDIAQSLANLASIARRRGDFSSALDYQKKALRIFEKRLPNHFHSPAQAPASAVIARSQGDTKAADEYHQRAKALFEKLSPKSSDLALMATNYGSTLMLRGDNEEAKKELQRAIELSHERNPGSLLEATCLLNMGEFHHRQGQLEEALKHYTRALDLARRTSPTGLRTADAMTALANVKARQGNLEEGIKLFEQAIEIIESHRAKFSSAEARRHIVNYFQLSYIGLIRARLALHHNDQAFTALERSRSRLMIDRLFERRSQLEDKGPPKLLERQEQLDLRRESLYRQLSGFHPERNKKQIEEIRQLLASIAAQQRELELRIRSASPKFAALHYPQPLDATACKKSLDPGTLLLRYFVDDDRAFLFAIQAADPDNGDEGRTIAGVFPIHLTRKELQAKVRSFRSKIVARQPIVEASRDLAKYLITPARDLIDGAKRILVCPDGVLHSLPFAALVVDRPETKSGDPLRYLADLKPLHTISSITIYSQMRQQKKVSTTPKLIAFGSPDYGNSLLAVSPSRGLTLVKTDETKAANKKAAKTTGKSGVLSVLAALPATEQEVQTISKIYGKSATALVGKAASEQAAKQATQSATILHFACHGLVDDKDPFASGVALSPGKDEDGILRAWEIIKDLRLNCDLVVLSACETGLGTTLEHEGVIGLTTAFQYAGARSIVVSYWSIPDKSTAFFMSEFYRQLRAGVGKDQALQKAAQAVREQPQWKHPWHWAAFQLVGDWR